MNLLERTFKKKPDGFKRQTILNQCKEVDNHNYNVRRNNAKDREHLKKEIHKTVDDLVFGRFTRAVKMPRQPFYIRIIKWIKKQLDIKKGVYSAKQKYVVDKETGKSRWEYIK